MGDRANIIVQERNGSIFLYTHWAGYRVRKILARALDRGRDRWDDIPYLTRIIFSEMLIGTDLEDTAGFGISTEHMEPGNDLWVNPNAQTVRIGADEIPFEDFIERYKK